MSIIGTISNGIKQKLGRPRSTAEETSHILQRNHHGDEHWKKSCFKVLSLELIHMNVKDPHWELLPSKSSACHQWCPEPAQNPIIGFLPFPKLNHGGTAETSTQWFSSVWVFPLESLLCIWVHSAKKKWSLAISLTMGKASIPWLVVVLDQYVGHRIT